MGEAMIGENLAIAAAGLAICLLGLVQALLDRNLERRVHRFFVIIFSLLVAYVSFNLVSQMVDDYTGGVAVTAQRAALFFESLVSASATVALLAFLIVACGEDWRHSVVLSLAVLLRRSNRLSARERTAFGVYIILPAAAMVFQMLFYGLYVIVLGTAVAAFVMFTYIQSDQVERYYWTEVENARLKSDILLSQLQPHFLCNTLGAIGRLCRNDPEAKEAINAFSRYLRENVDALSQEAPVPFERELEHAQTYLELERLRFGEDLLVSYRIGCTKFLIPTLTLQPLVENAVRHGIRGTEDGTGTVTVSSREFDNRWEVAVADDGAGFEPGMLPDDGRPHVGLANVRERLRIVCGGDLRVDS